MPICVIVGMSSKQLALATIYLVADASSPSALCVLFPSACSVLGFPYNYVRWFHGRGRDHYSLSCEA